MPDWSLPTTDALQAKIVAEADEQTLILASGGRLARQLRHAFRSDRMGKGSPGWRPPRVLSLNAWVEDTWRNSWPEESPASPLKILRLWEEAVQKNGLPEGLIADTRLYETLDETYQARIRNKVPPLKNGYGHPLILCREEVFGRFEQNLSELGQIHPVILTLKVLQDLLKGAPLQYRKILLVGFEFPAPVESDLLSVLKKRHGAISCSTQPVREPTLSALSFPNQEEEVIWLSEQVLLSARETPLHRIGIVVPTLSHYAPLFLDSFREIIGPSVAEETGGYNISLGQPLWDRPLVQAGLLPLRFFLEGETRTLLLSCLLSPYYRLFKPYHLQAARADSLWRKKSIDSGLRALLQSLSNQQSERSSSQNIFEQTFVTLNRILNQGRQSGGKWVEALLQCWQLLDFPAVALTGEEGFYEHFRKILEIFRHDLHSTLLEGSQFFAWLKTLLNQTLVNEPGYEQSGLQVLGLIEARGLAFDRLFLAGLSKGSLPQPVRSFPFLTPEERRLVLGATLKSQYDFARITFSHLKTIAPLMTLTRPEEEKGNPLPPSPFWPEISEKKERNYWKVPGKVWIRAEWLKQTAQGMKKYPNPLPLEEPPLKGVSLPSTLAATAVETALSCPFKFFAERLLQIAPLDEIVIGISPQERGEVLHAILALITRTIRRKKISIAEEDLSVIVRHCVQEVLKGKSHDPHWMIEQKRLTGEAEGEKGLIGAWLEEEKNRWENGWRWEGEEISFSGLAFPSCSFLVQGRIDRVDFHETSEEVCCFDYKTGVLPHSNDITKQFLSPQLPLYLLALKTNPGLLKKSFKGLRAGYLGLKSQGEMEVREPLEPASAWDACLTDWERELAELGKRLADGTFPADPRPKPIGSNQGACTYCPYVSLCLYWKKE
jgi:ATP-dependent helicase/nuclease subunit B